MEREAAGSNHQTGLIRPFPWSSGIFPFFQFLPDDCPG
jgi:hypothetical protein